MTTIRTMTPKTTATGVLLACIGAAALIVVLQIIEQPRSGGWRSTNIDHAAVATSVLTRATNALGASAAIDTGETVATRGRN